MTLIFNNLMSDDLKMCVEHLDFWIKTTDAIMDRAIKPEFALDAAELGVKSFGWINKHPGLWDKLEGRLFDLLEAAREDAEYIPNRFDLETDKAIWAAKAGRLSLDFACVCYGRPEFDTPENWAWVKEAQEFGLKINDCKDILSERYEDLIQVRRNWVLLSMDKNIFINWKQKLPEIRQAAQKILDELCLMPPTGNLLSEYHKQMIKMLFDMRGKYDVEVKYE